VQHQTVKQKDHQAEDFEHQNNQGAEQ